MEVERLTVENRRHSAIENFRRIANERRKKKKKRKEEGITKRESDISNKDRGEIMHDPLRKRLLRLTCGFERTKFCHVAESNESKIFRISQVRCRVLVCVVVS